MYSSDIYNALNVATVQAAVSAYGTGYAIFNSLVVPADCEGAKTINFYQLGPIDASSDERIAKYTCNCRAGTQQEALSIALVVVNEINREMYSDYYLICQIGQPIRPQDDTDNFNYPVEITIKKR